MTLPSKLSRKLSAHHKQATLFWKSAPPFPLRMEQQLLVPPASWLGTYFEQAPISAVLIVLRRAKDRLLQDWAEPAAKDESILSSGNWTPERQYERHI